MTQALILAVILIILGADPLELLSGAVRLFVAIVASLFVIALVVGVIITAPNLLLGGLGVLVVASYVMAAIGGLKSLYRRHFQ